MNPSLIHTFLSKNRKKGLNMIENKQQNFVFSNIFKNTLIYQNESRITRSKFAK